MSLGEKVIYGREYLESELYNIDEYVLPGDKVFFDVSLRLNAEDLLNRVVELMAELCKREAIPPELARSARITSGYRTADHNARS